MEYINVNDTPSEEVGYAQGMYANLESERSSFLTKESRGFLRKGRLHFDTDGRRGRQRKPFQSGKFYHSKV